MHRTRRRAHAPGWGWLISALFHAAALFTLAALLQPIDLGEVAPLVVEAMLAPDDLPPETLSGLIDDLADEPVGVLRRQRRRGSMDLPARPRFNVRVRSILLPRGLALPSDAAAAPPRLVRRLLATGAMNATEGGRVRSPRAGLEVEPRRRKHVSPHAKNRNRLA